MNLNLILPDSDVNLKVTYAYDNLNRLIGEYGYNTDVNPATSVYERLFGYAKAGSLMKT